MTSSDKQLALSIGLTAQTNQLCLGLESGAADILELVTPTIGALSRTTGLSRFRHDLAQCNAVWR